MTAKATPSRLCLVIIVLLAATATECVRAQVPTSNRALRFHQNDIRIKRKLWTTGITSPTTKDDSDRAFNTASLKEIAEGGIQKLSTATKNLAEGVKLKFTSDKQKATNILFTRLKVDQVESDLFNSAQFKAWATSVSKVYKTNTKASNSAMVSTLTAHYGDEALTSMLFAAEEIPETAMVVLQLQRAQMESWVTKKLPAEDIFQFLKLDTTGDNLLKSPLLQRWMEFLTNVGKENPYELVFLKLAKRYDDESLANMLLGTKSQLM